MATLQTYPFPSNFNSTMMISKKTWREMHNRKKVLIMTLDRDLNHTEVVVEEEGTEEA